MGTELISNQQIQYQMYPAAQPVSPAQLVFNYTRVNGFGELTIHGVNQLGQNAIETVSDPNEDEADNPYSCSYTTSTTFASLAYVINDGFGSGYLEVQALDGES